jgi:Pyruvate/2-oxoacid:ferredoxin oxidoreductase gamma subunit
MTKPDDVLYIHEPQAGLFVVGVPARDLTRADVDRMSPRRLNEALATGLYRKASRDEKTEAEKEAEKQRKREQRAAATAARKAAKAAKEAAKTQPEPVATNDQSNGDVKAE